MIPSSDAQPTPRPGIGRVPQWAPIPSHEYGRRSSQHEITDVLELLQEGRVAVLTGAGMSTQSGLPDYRGRDAQPRTPMTFHEFTSSKSARQRYWARSSVGWPRFTQAEPNAAHLALSELARHLDFTGLITQNVDGLHQKAGSKNVIDLHGRLDRVICLDCGATTDRDALQERLLAANSGLAARIDELAQDARQAPDGDAEVDRVDGFVYAACATCGGTLKPDVVFFGESARRDLVDAAFAAVAEADVLLVLGSSLSVQSGLRFVRQALRDGKGVVIAGDGPTRADDRDVIRVYARLEELLPAWVDMARKRA